MAAIPATSAITPPAADEPGLDISAVLDRAAFGKLQFLVLIFTFVTLVMDGFDIQAIAFAAPALTKEWNIERSALGPVLASALLGMALGAALIGQYGDRRGRRSALITSCALMAVGSICSSMATGPLELGLFRFVTGVGMGGAMPNSTALMFEFAPLVWRQVATSIALVGVPLGGMLGAALARTLVPEIGWRALFVVGGLIPGMLALVMWRLMPESPRYLSTRPERVEELSRLLNRISGQNIATAATRFIGAASAAGGSTVAAIFERSLRSDTLILWLIFFTNVFSIYFFFNWLPTVLSAANLEFGVAVSGSLYFNLGGVVGSLISSVLVVRYGSRLVLGVVAVAAVASVVGIAFNAVFTASSADTAGLMMAMATAGACVNAVQIGMFSVAANVYPTQCRSTGVGWSLAFARFGGIVSSFAGAAFFAMGMQPQQFFLFIAGMLAVTLVGVMVLRRHISPA
jgi:AAHS family 4-hydroxybenzoate transporter-like MFS transporter